MSVHAQVPNEPGRVLVFGPQALSLSPANFQDILALLSESEKLGWILNVIKQLPGCWETFIGEFPKYGVEQASLSVSALKAAFESGSLEVDFSRLPNIILSPLVVIAHLCEYVEYLDGLPTDHNQAARLPTGGARTQVLGFCTGLLSAIAVSLSSQVEDIQTFGAKAIRLAMIMGGIVDAQNVLDKNGASSAMAIAWNSPKTREDIDRILEGCPGSYISVSYDDRRATVTTAESTKTSLQQKFRQAGIVANEIGLHGRFHSEWYLNDIDQLIRYCGSQPDLALPDASESIHAIRSDSPTGALSRGPLHEHALRAILVDHCNWYAAFKAVYDSTLQDREDTTVVTFGPGRCIPPSLATKLEGRQQSKAQQPENSKPQPRKSDDIAVIGMSLKVAGADDATEFWDLLCEAKSQHQEVPRERVSFDPCKWRDTDGERKWYGNFLRDPDAFDHKFFKKSAREASFTDPQQRLLLQVAYQALEQSGYFNSNKVENDRIGSYFGVTAADYEYNVAGEKPNAFTAVGNLKGFIAGKISHYFGWTGTSMCIDTACSSSLVAVHLACKAILSGECTAALAGGVNIITNPLWFQNLAGASFLSPTGQCKPFDASGDGYCRGEAIAAVFLKKMSTAIEDGDQILATISSTAVNNNVNCTPIFVPNPPSLTSIFHEVLERGEMSPSQVTYAEAHGTGTAVGDPAEYDSIRQVLGGPKRSSTLSFGSVKGLIGHAESTSGVVSLIKTVLMAQRKAIPAQPSFKQLNPHLGASPADRMEIVTETKAWEGSRVALINNYGASGSNASALVTQAPSLTIDRLRGGASTNLDYPFRLCGKDKRALEEYSSKLHQFLVRAEDSESYLSLENLSFNICRQSNPSLDQAWVFSARSTDQLLDKLKQGIRDDSVVASPASRPVILCFGGQVSTSIGLDRNVYASTTVLRQNLEECDAICQSIGCESIFPGIFDKNPIADPVQLQTMLFSMQYSCARSWLQCGIQPVAVIGHSFGELTSLCVSGVLSVEDAIKMVAGRAKIIKDSWGSDRGSMVAVEADSDDVRRLLAETSPLCEQEGYSGPNIACHNGPRSFTIAGPSKSIEIMTETMLKTSTFSAIKFKKLNVSHAFHSTLVENLKSDLEDLGRTLVFNEPTIPVERSTEIQSSSGLRPRYLADHMRDSVYFRHAVERLAKKHPNAIWLEAGSNSSVTSMVGKSLRSADGAHLQPINITNENGLQQLVNATTSLWKQGLVSTTFWPHHRSQTYRYTPVILPAYQFEKSRHWIELKAPMQTSSPAEQPGVKGEEVKELWTFLGYKDGAKQSARFRINTSTEKYMSFVSGHTIAHTAPICPATLEVDMAIEAVMSLLPEPSRSEFQPKIRCVENQSPLCVDHSRPVWLDLEAINGSSTDWQWKLISESQSGSSTTVHVTGTIEMISIEDKEWRYEFSRYERMVGHQRCASILATDDADDIIQGRNIYKAFGGVVNYGQQYRGLQKLVGMGNVSAGRVVKQYSQDTWLDVHLSDCFSQVGGIWANCMTDISPEEMYIATGFESWMRSPDLTPAYTRPETWDVLGNHQRVSDQLYLTDLFIFDPTNGKLLEVILGINYHKVPKASMSKILSRLTASSYLPAQPAQPVPESGSLASSHGKSSQSETSPEKVQPQKGKDTSSRSREIEEKTRGLLAEIAGLGPESIQADVRLADLGIDSLMGMELARDLEGLFKCSLSSDELINVEDFRGLVKVIQETLGVEAPSEGADDDSAESEDGSSVTPDGSTSSATSAGEIEDSKTINIGNSGGNLTDLELPPSSILAAFEDSKRITDKLIEEHGCAGYLENVLPKQTQLCIALIVEAFEQLGCSLRSAKAGQTLKRVEHVPQQRLLVNYLYEKLEHDARLIDIDGSTITRTAVTVVPKPSEKILTELVREFPNFEGVNRLTSFAASRLADVVTGQCDGIKLIFGSEEGRKLVADLYGNSLLNNLANAQMQDVITRLVSSIPPDQGPLKIMELGAGTGGTTIDMVALLGKLGVPVEYTFTDLSASFVAAARRKFSAYPFMKFRVYDIEKAPDADIVGTQHIIISSNAVHATHNVEQSVQNIRKALRPDGFLMMLEMTTPLIWVDLIFGLFEGWWLFDDGREHAIAHQTVWEQALRSAGYGHVDWSDGHTPEIELQRIIIALASGPQYDRQSLPPPPPLKTELESTEARGAAVEDYVRKYAKDFTEPGSLSNTSLVSKSTERTVLITGASGSLGSHLSVLPVFFSLAVLLLSFLLVT